MAVIGVGDGSTGAAVGVAVGGGVVVSREGA